MADCSSLEAAYLLAEAAEAVAAATHAVKQAEADLAYQDLMTASTNKWSAWWAWMSCVWGWGMRAVYGGQGDLRLADRNIRLQHIDQLKVIQQEAIERHKRLAM